MNPVQLKMARVAAGWDVEMLAQKAGVSVANVVRLESGGEAPKGVAAALQTTLEAAGLDFLPPEGTAGPGVRLRSNLDTAAELTRRIDAIDAHLANVDLDVAASPRRGMQQLEVARKRDIGVKLRNRRTKLKTAEKP